MPEDLDSLLHDGDLQQRYIAVRERVRNEFLRFWQVHSPHFTDHGESHCETIKMTIPEIIEPEIIRSLNEYEIFFLLCSIWLHDIGMMVSNDEVEKDETIRDSHHERSKVLIKSQFNNLLTTNEIISIGDICCAHSRKIEINTIPETRIIRHSNIGNTEIRVRFLASLLRFFDALDLCSTRTAVVIPYTKPPEKSSFYHAMHDSVWNNPK